MTSVQSKGGKVTIDEAIANLSIQIEGKHPLAQKHQAEAIQLGIEALVAVQYVRRNYPDILPAPLPGETEN